MEPRVVQSFFPTLVMIPLAFLVQTFDWQVRAWQVRFNTFPRDYIADQNGQPYVALSRGNAPAEQSILLDYVCPSLFYTPLLVLTLPPDQSEVRPPLRYRATDSFL